MGKYEEEYSASGRVIYIKGIGEVISMFERIRTTDPKMEQGLRKLITKVLRVARSKVSKDALLYMNEDPRQAHKAVRHVVYKKVLGGNINILKKRKASNKRAQLIRPRKLDQNPHQRGGNRRKRSARTEQLDSYFASDRGFVLRFLAGVPEERKTRYGSRGSMKMTGWFGAVAPRHMEEAIDQLKKEAQTYIIETANGKQLTNNI